MYEWVGIEFLEEWGMPAVVLTIVEIQLIIVIANVSHSLFQV